MLEVGTAVIDAREAATAVSRATANDSDEKVAAQEEAAVNDHVASSDKLSVNGGQTHGRPVHPRSGAARKGTARHRGLLRGYAGERVGCGAPIVVAVGASGVLDVGRRGGVGVL